MARKQAQPEPEAAQESNKPTEQNPLEAFATHQRNAAVEAGRALASLIPRGLRVHGWNAIEESAKGFGAIVGVVAGFGD